MACCILDEHICFVNTSEKYESDGHRTAAVLPVRFDLFRKLELHGQGIEQYAH